MEDRTMTPDVGTQYGPAVLHQLADGFHYAQCPELAQTLREMAYLWDSDLKWKPLDCPDCPHRGRTQTDD